MIKLKDAISLAYESITLYKFRSFLSILGVTIGVAAVIAGIILGLGNRESIMQKMARSGADVLWFYESPKGEGFPRLEDLGYQPALSITREDVEYIKKQCQTIKDISPYLLTPAVAFYGGKYKTIKALGVLLPQEAARLFDIEIVAGRGLTDHDVAARTRICVIEASEFTKEVFQGQSPLGKELMVGTDKYKIVGVSKGLRFPFGYPERLIAIFPSSAIQDTLGIRKFSTVELTVNNISDVPETKRRLREALIQRFGLPLKLYISEYAAYVQTALEILNLLTFIIIGIAIISLMVGGVGIMNVMMARVAEQTKEIGVAKAIGAKRRAILLLFLTEATILTLSGGLLGVGFGLGASKLITWLVGIPFIVPLWVIFLGLLLSFSVGIVSGSYPAKRAAELDPIEALRRL